MISALNIGNSDLLHGGLHQRFSTCEDFGVKILDMPRESGILDSVLGSASDLDIATAQTEA